MTTSDPPYGMIQRLRTWRHASPAVAMFEPGYWVIAWISTPVSAPGRFVTPGVIPDWRTPRQNGALLPGWLFARCALLSSGFGSGGTTLLPAAAEGAAAAGAVAVPGTSSGRVGVAWPCAAPARARAASTAMHHGLTSARIDIALPIDMSLFLIG